LKTATGVKERIFSTFSIPDFAQIKVCKLQGVF